MRFRFFEYVFFVSAFGTIALFPFVTPFMPLLRVGGIVLLLLLTTTSLITALYGAWKNTEKQSAQTIALTALMAGCAALFAGTAMEYMPPAFLGWGIMAFIATLTFGSILARRFFRRVEKDFRRNIGHVMAVSLVGNATLLILLAFIGMLTPPIAAPLTAILTLAALL